jgi:hypothetical protein
MEKHLHHIVPRSRGGSDDPSNLVELDFIEHAIHHAHDFLNGGPRFDFRQEGWPYLPKDLAEAVLDKAREHTSAIMKNKPKTLNQLLASKRNAVHLDRTPEKQSKRGKIAGEKSRNEKTGIFNPDNSEKVAQGKLEGLKKCWEKPGPRGSHKTLAMRFQCTVTGYISNPTGLSSYQRARGIDTSNRVKLDN